LKINKHDHGLEHYHRELYLLGACSVAQKALHKNEQATASLNKLYNSENNNIMHLFNGWIQFNLEKYSEAIYHLDQIDNASINDLFKPYISALKGKSHFSLNHLGRAWIEMDNAINQVPEHEEWNKWKDKLTLGFKKTLKSDLEIVKRSWDDLASKVSKIDSENIELGATIAEGYTKVYSAQLRDTNINRTVLAIKRITLNTDTEKRTKREIYLQWFMSTKLDQNCFIKLFGWYTEKLETFAYIIMEKGDMDLNQFLIDKKPDETLKLQLLVPIVRGIRFLHSLEVAHRDIKPENILIFSHVDQQHPQVKICDIGLSRTVSASNTDPVGTYCYMAPEIIQASTQREMTCNELLKADIWAIGKLIYFIWAKPLNVSNKEEHLQNLKNQSIVALIKSCLDKNPIQRIGIDELLQQLSIVNSNDSS